MLTCIACSKQLKTNRSLPERLEDDDDNSPSTKQAVKSLTIQIKDIALKASCAYTNCKPCSGKDRNHGCVDSDVGSVSERLYGSYRRTGGSYSTTPRLNRKELEAKIMAFSSGSATPASVSSRIDSIVFLEEDEPTEWVAQVEPGVLITFVSLPQGGNDLKRIRFSREIFNKWQAQKWWTENYEKVLELYNVRRRLNQDDAPLPTPPQSEDQDSVQESGEESPMTPPLSKERLPHHFHHPKSANRTTPPQHHRHHHHNHHQCHNSTPKYSSVSAAKTEEASSVDASVRSSNSSREVDHSGELSMSNASDLENEWVEQDEPGVYITIRALPSGGRELRRVRFSREMFGETQARVWWEENKARIQKQYL